MSDLLYAERDPEALDEAGGYYMKHVMAMTSENLHSKAAIAAELAHRDKLIAEFKELWYELCGNADTQEPFDVCISSVDYEVMNDFVDSI